MLNLRLFGISLELHWSFFLLLGLAAQTPALLTGLCAAACHELGHLAAMKLCRVPAGRFRLSLWGGRLSAGHFPTPSAELFCLAAGPGVNLLLWAAAFLWGKEPLRFFSAVNLVLGGFNLLPVPGLDGGRMVALLLSAYLGENTVCKAAGCIAAVTLVLLWLWAFLLLQRYPQLPALLVFPLTATLIFLRQGRRE